MAATDGALGGAARVIEFIEHEAAERGLGPGSRLPTERDIAERSGRSRAAVRRALEALEAEGRVVRHVGRGTFLAPAAGSGADDPPEAMATSPAEIMAVRLLIEPQMMPLAVAAATPADFDEMKRCLRGGDAAEGYEDFEVWDAALHRAIAQSTHNGLVLRIIQMINAARGQPLWGSLKRRSSTVQRRTAYKRDHRDIVMALTERDAETAHRAMRRHLLRVRANIFGADA